MKTSSSNHRGFGVLALVLLGVGILVPIVIPIISVCSPISWGLALVFGVIARHHVTGKVALWGLAVVAVVVTSTLIIITALRSTREKEMATSADIEQVTRPVFAEQPPAR
jgi:short subunit fatty acids transporter